MYTPHAISYHIFLHLKNMHIAIIGIFRGPKTHDTKNLREFKNFFLIHLTFIKNILHFKINRRTQMFTDKQTTDIHALTDLNHPIFSI